MITNPANYLKLPDLTGARPQQALDPVLEKHARTFVSQTFFGTLLKQMEDSPFKSELFSGGRGGQAFSPLYHQHLAERMSRGVGDKLVRAIVRKLDATRAYNDQGAGVPAAQRLTGGTRR